MPALLRPVQFFVFILCSATGLAQVKTEGFLGKAGYDILYSAAATNDGGYILTGLTQSMGDTMGDIAVVKVGAHGDTLWTLLHGGPLLEGGNFVMQTADGGYMVSGHTEDFGAQDCDAFLMKLDNNGKYQWLKVYGGAEDDISEGVIELPNGDFVIAGITASFCNPSPSELRHVYFVKTNSKGDAIWSKCYGGSGEEYAFSVAACSAGGMIAVGYTSSFGNGERDGWILRLNDNGDTLWTRRWQAEGETKYHKIIPTADNGFIVTGYTTPTKTCKPLGLAIKLDRDGHETWRRTYGATSTGLRLFDVAQLPTGNLVFSGVCFREDANGNAYVLTTDADGNGMAEQLFGGSG